ncbi:unnamed protein product [Dicrocoelium dendriticum]|nr:unnamed protein product [Dicrocoelium dendriticum]CAH8519187.1 unnamed protein product [Dicrocoelium dendriticum]
MSGFPTRIAIWLLIEDYDTTGNDEMALIHEILHFESRRTRLRLNHPVFVEIVVNIECTKHYYGPQCNVYCQPKDGHWSCNPQTGDRICAKSCYNGVCKIRYSVAVCSCLDGWHGEFCERYLHFGYQLSPSFYMMTTDRKVDSSTAGSDEYGKSSEEINSKRFENISALASAEKLYVVINKPLAIEGKPKVSACSVLFIISSLAVILSMISIVALWQYRRSSKKKLTQRLSAFEEQSLPLE